MALTTAQAEKVSNGYRAPYRVVVDGKTKSYYTEASALDIATKQARKSGEAVAVTNVFEDRAIRITPTGRVVDGNSIRVSEAKKPYCYRTRDGFSGRNQLQVNRQRVLVEGSRCKVQGVRGTFVFIRYVKNGEKEWAEVREIERDRWGNEATTRFRAFRPERLKTAPGWNN